MVGAWSAHVLRMVGGMGRAALYLKVSPNGLWPAARSRPVAGFKGCRPVPPTPPLGGQPRFFGSGLLACLLARLLACLLVFSPGFLVQACWLACLLACLLVCLFSALFQTHSFAHSEHQPKECYIESRQLSVPRAQPARTASRPARLEAALASLQRARTKGVRRQPAPPRPKRARAKGKGEGCHSHAPTLNEHSPSAFPLQAGGSAEIYIYIYIHMYVHNIYIYIHMAVVVKTPLYPWRTKLIGGKWMFIHPKMEPYVMPHGNMSTML